MNVFVIPSWYPSYTDPQLGVFFKDQAMALTKQFPDLKMGISTWGQNDERLLLWSKQPFHSLSKLLIKSKPEPTIKLFNDENLIEYFTPAFTWNSNMLHGNMKQIIKLNLKHLDEFQNVYGKTDIIHAHVGFPGGYIAKKISDTHKIPYIITEHMSPFPHKCFLDKQKNMNGRLKEAYNLAAKNISVSKNLNVRMKSYGIGNITTIPNLVDETFFKPPPSPHSNDIFTFFSLGRMVPQKGIDILLKAFAKIRVDAKLRIGGSGEYLKTYQKLAGDLEISNKVQWLGELDKNNALMEYQCCDAFVLPSRHESMGVVFVEAMACGKPVIGTICGGPEEFINDINGLLIQSEDENGLVRALESMMENHQNFDPNKIRKQFEKRFSSEIVCSQIMEVYTQVINSYYLI